MSFIISHHCVALNLKCSKYTKTRFQPGLGTLRRFPGSPVGGGGGHPLPIPFPQSTAASRLDLGAYGASVLSQPSPT